MLSQIKFFKPLIVVLATMIIASCGFSPVYKSTEGEASVQQQLAKVKISSPDSLEGQAFKTRLEDLINPTAKQSEKEYLAEYNLSIAEVPLAIQQDRTITRFKIIITADYTMTKIETGEVVSKGEIRREGGYDKVESDYATYISQEDTKKRVLREVAEDARVRIMSVIL